jgi:hypothetical protein
LQIEHIVPKSHGGSNRVSNLTIACGPCNRAKDNRSIEDFVTHDPMRLSRINAQRKRPLKDAGAVNTTRYAIGNALKSLGLATTFWSGGRTKINRVAQGYEKDHWLDAACVGEHGAYVQIRDVTPLKMKATGRGTRQVTRTDAYGFPRGAAKTAKRRHGLQTGDLVRAVIGKGKAPGIYVGRISATAKTRFDLKTPNGTIGTTARNLTLVQRDFGYALVA